MSLKTVALPPGTVLEAEIPFRRDSLATRDAVTFGYLRESSGELVPHLRMRDGSFKRVLQMVGGPPVTAYLPEGFDPNPKTTIQQPSPLSADALVSLPADVDDVIVGGDGRFLLLAMRTIQKVAVFDLRDATIRKFINVDSEQFFVAGGKREFVVATATDPTLEVWNYDNLERPRIRTQVDMKGRLKLIGAAMGFSSEGPLGLSFQYEQPFSGKPFVELFDLAKPAPLNYGTLYSELRTTVARDPSRFQLYASPTGDLFSGMYPTALDTLTLSRATATMKLERVASTAPSDPYLLGLDGKTEFHSSTQRRTPRTASLIASVDNTCTTRAPTPDLLPQAYFATAFIQNLNE